MEQERNDQPEHRPRMFTPQWWMRTIRNAKGGVREPLWERLLKNGVPAALGIAMAGLLYWQVMQVKPSAESKTARADTTAQQAPVEPAEVVKADQTAEPLKQDPPAYKGLPEHNPNNYILTDKPAPRTTDWMPSEADMKRNKSELDHKALPLWCWLLVPLAGGLLMWISFAQLRKKINEKREKDPQALRQLLTHYEQEVKKLGTPRKIKRFTNKVRLQYQHLRNTGVLPPQDEQHDKPAPRTELFFFMLLQLESRRQQWVDSRRDFERGFAMALSRMSDLDSRGWDRNDFSLASKNSLLSQLYELNRGVII